MSQGYPVSHVTDPYIVGGAIIALQCKDGIVIGADTLLSYGSLLKYTDVTRFQKIGQQTIIASSGQYADFQQLSRKLKCLVQTSGLGGDSFIGTKQLTNYLAHIAYEKRNNMNPFYNNTIICGYKNGQPLMASVDLYGTLIKKSYLCTGFAKHFGLALIANEWNQNCSMQQGKQVIRRCFQVIYMRDCHSIDQIQIATVTPDNIQIGAPQKIQSRWNFKQFRERANEKLWQ